MQDLDPSRDTGALDALAEEFIASHRRGERPVISDYIAKLPGLAERISDLFPTLVMMENARPGGGHELGGRVDSIGAANDRMLEQLGDYRILREIGRGGMGIVYEAEQEALGRHVAVKVLPKHAMLDRRQLDRFHHEARAAARLHHTNIVPVFGVGNHEGLHYHVMQFIQGLGLDEVLVEVVRLRDQKQATSRFGKLDSANSQAPASDARSNLPNSRAAAPPVVRVAEALLSGQFQCSADGLAIAGTHASFGANKLESLPSEISSTGGENCNRTALPEGRSPSSDIHLPGQDSNKTESGGAYWSSVARIGVQVADALAYANSQGVLHRDIKPSNLLLDATGTVWVTDFGLAKTSESDDLTHTGDIVGTLRYMAPERFRGQSDIQCDIYSLGMTLYELLTLRHPFVELDRHKLVRQIASEEPANPRSIDRSLPRDLETIVLKAIAKQPSDRYQNAESLAADLRRFLEDRPIQARRIGSAEWFWRWCRRNPLVAGLAAAVVLLATVLSVGAGVMHLVRSERDRAVVNLNLAIVAEKAAKENQQRAEQADGEIKIRSHLAQAAAYRHAGQPGRRIKSLEEIRQAVELRPAPSLRTALRDEAIACLALVDLQSIDIPETTGESRIAFDREYLQYATVDEEGRIHVRRVGEPEELCELPGLGHSAVGLVFSQFGNYLLSCSLDSIRIQIWHIASGRAVFAEPVASNTIPALSHDETKVAIVLDNGSIGIFELANGNELDRLWTNAFPRLVAFDPPGLRLAVSSTLQSELEVWDLSTKASVTKWVDVKANIHSIAWDPEGRRLAIGLAFPAICAEILDVATGQKLATFNGHSGDVTDSLFHPSGDILLTRSWDGFSRVWDANSGRLFLAWPGGTGGNLSADGRVLGLIHNRGQNRMVELIAEHEYQTLVSSLGAGKGVYRDGSISPDGRLFALGMDDGVRIWDLLSNEEVAFISTGQSPSPLFGEDGTELITSGESGLQRWPVSYGPLRESLKPKATSEGNQSVLITSAIDSSDKLNFSDEIYIGPPRDVQLLDSPSYISSAKTKLGVCSPRSSRAMIVDLTADRLQATLGIHPRLDRIVLSPDGRLAATYGWHSPTVKIWDLSTSLLTKELPAMMLTVNFSPDSQQLITCDNNEYSFWDTVTWLKTKSIAREHCPFSGVIAFSSDGKLMALELSSAIISLLDAKSGETLAKLEDPYRDRSNWMNFTPDGTKLVTVSNYSQGVNVWNLSSIRTKLSGLGLDWDARPLIEQESIKEIQPPQVTVDLGDFGLRFELKRQARQAKVLYDLANEQIQSKRWSEALQTFNKALAIRPEVALYNNGLAWLLVSCPEKAIRDGGLAVQLARKTVEQEPESSEYWNTLGVAYFRTGQWQPSIDALTTAEQLKPDENFGHNAFFLAMAYWQLGETQSAHELYEQAVQWMNSADPSASEREEIELFHAEAIELLRM